MKIKLEQIVTFANTGADAIKRAPIVEYDTGIKCLRTSDVSNNKPFNQWGFCKVSEKHYKQYSLKKGDIIIARTGPIGKCYFIKNDLPAVYNNGLMKIRVDESHFYPLYVYYFIKSDHFERYINQVGSGSATRPNIKMEIALNYEIEKWDISIQYKIASILSAYDDLIENNLRRIKILEEIAQSIYRAWFVKFRFPGHEKVRMVDSPFGKIPEGWRVGQLDDALLLQRGFDLPKKKRRLGSVPVYASTGVVGMHDQYKVKAPGIVTGRSGSLGKVIFVEDDFWPLNTTLWVKEFRNVTPFFAYYLLSELGLEGYNSGAAVPTLNRNDIHGLPVIIPAKSVLADFDTYMVPMFSLKRYFRLKNAQLIKTRDLLLPKLISGELDVSELDIAIPEEVA